MYVNSFQHQEQIFHNRKFNETSTLILGYAWLEFHITLNSLDFSRLQVKTLDGRAITSGYGTFIARRVKFHDGTRAGFRFFLGYSVKRGPGSARRETASLAIFLATEDPISSVGCFSLDIPVSLPWTRRVVEEPDGLRTKRVRYQQYQWQDTIFSPTDSQVRGLTAAESGKFQPIDRFSRIFSNMCHSAWLMVIHSALYALPSWHRFLENSRIVVLLSFQARVETKNRSKLWRIFVWL